MRRKKSISVFIFVLIAFIVLGVGYAAINNINLVINGTGSITVTQANFNVKFLDVDGHRPSITPGSPNTVSVIDNTTASFDVSTLSKKGDTATATIDVKNESNAVGARIGLNLTNSNDTYFKVTEHIADTELQAGDITTVTVTIEMLKTPISADETTNITATLTANPIENSNATGSNPAPQTPVNPYLTTFDGNYTYMSFDGEGEFDSSLNNEWNVYLRNDGSKNEVCGIFGSGQAGTVCLTGGNYESDFGSYETISPLSRDMTQEEQNEGYCYEEDYYDMSDDNDGKCYYCEYGSFNAETKMCDTDDYIVTGYPKAKMDEMISKGASYCSVNVSDVTCYSNTDVICYLDAYSMVQCNGVDGHNCYVDGDEISCN